MNRTTRLQARHRKAQRHTSQPLGFTLVEMLVAVGLVVLMMTLFTTIFQMSTGAMGKQKAIAENDQRVRLVQTVLRSDIKRRTMQLVAPYGPTDPLDDFALREGYFYIGESNPDIQTDDVLQFTAKASPDDPFFGKATLIPDNTATYATTPNQPEFDDASTNADGSSLSTWAEIVYFVRNGTLYRRVVLVREPLTALDPQDGQPKSGTNGGGANISLTPYEAAGATRNFYSDFDFSVALIGPTIEFHGPNSRTNGAGSVRPLGDPRWRFGFDFQTGLPREYADLWIDSSGNTVTGRKFFGRFTHEETSFIDPNNAAIAFGYPGRITTDAPNPYDDPATTSTPPGTSLTLDTRDGRITRYRGGSRISEDVLMTNVVQFDIKVYDDAASAGPDGKPGIGYDTAGAEYDDPGSGAGASDITEYGWPNSDDGEFVDLGHSGATGWYNDASLLNLHRNAQGFCYNPAGPPAKPYYRYDTWFRNFDINGGGADDPPFRPLHKIPAVANQAAPLKAIQIRIQYWDPAKEQLRDTTTVFSLKQDSTP